MTKFRAGYITHAYMHTCIVTYTLLRPCSTWLKSKFQDVLSYAEVANSTFKCGPNRVIPQTMQFPHNSHSLHLSVLNLFG